MSHSRQSWYIPLAPTPLSRYSKKLLFFLSSFFSWFPQVTSPVAYCKGEIYPASRKRTAYGVRAGLFLVDKTSSTSDWISNQINNPPRQKADLCKRKAMSLDRFSVPIATKNQKKKRGCCYSFFPRHFLLSPKKLLFSFDSLLSLTTKQSFSSSSLFSRFVPIFLEGERASKHCTCPPPPIDGCQGNRWARTWSACVSVRLCRKSFRQDVLYSLSSLPLNQLRTSSVLFHSNGKRNAARRD